MQEFEGKIDSVGLLLLYGTGVLQDMSHVNVTLSLLYFVISSSRRFVDSLPILNFVISSICEFPVSSQ